MRVLILKQILFSLVLGFGLFTNVYSECNEEQCRKNNIGICTKLSADGKTWQNIDASCLAGECACGGVRIYFRQ